MKYILLLTAITTIGFISISCKKEEKLPEQPTCCIYFDTAVGFRLTDSTGRDLLDPKSENRIGRLEFYNIIKGEKKRSAEIHTIKHPDYYYLDVLVQQTNNELNTTSLLQVNDREIRIKSQFRAGSPYPVIDKVWIDDSLAWEFGNGMRLIKMVIK